jgi:UDP-N-acetylmuramate--alanine ligase
MNREINISDIKQVYFVGIGGIGMSALARFFKARGVVVSGYDKTPTVLTDTLVCEGIDVHFNDDPTSIPASADVFIYTPAIPVDNKVLQACKQSGKPFLKRSDLLQIVSKGTYNICIAGTHGKTTISTMVAHVLRDSGFGCNAFLGGIASNYGTNFWSSSNQVCVIEADEYDRSFLKLFPNVICITAMDPDHLDIYGTAEEMEKSFILFTQNLKENGLLISRKGLTRENDLHSDLHLTYQLQNEEADIHTVGLKVENGSYHFNVKGAGWVINDMTLHMGGLHNVENSLVAISIAKHLGIDDEKIRHAVASFKGVKRRFEYIVRNEENVYIDDYAHHPEELKALISGVRSLYPSKKMVMLFQPHLFTRTRDLADEFAASLDLADEVYLLPIYPARELPIEGVDSNMIASRMKHPAKLITKEEMLLAIKENRPSLFVTAGAGDVDKMINDIKSIMS